MKRPANLNELTTLVSEAVYEVSELRACLEHDDEEASIYTPYLNSLDSMLREPHEAMTSGKYEGVGPPVLRQPQDGYVSEDARPLG